MQRIKTLRAWVPGVAPRDREEPGETGLCGLPSE
jgi:hypothetical protein